MWKLAALMILATAAACLADETGVLVVTGNGAEGRPKYDAGGKVEFTDVWTGAQVVHYDGGDELPLHIGLKYIVHETADILHSEEKVDLRQAGEGTCESFRSRLTARYGPLPAKGLCGINGRRYFLIREPEGDWIDVVDPPPFFSSTAAARNATVTLADLSEFSLQIGEVQSTWQPGGPLRVQVTITDADGDTFPVVNCELSASAEGGDWQAPMQTEWGTMCVPTGYMTATLPEGDVPEQVTVAGRVIMRKEYKTESFSEGVERTIARGEGLVTPEQLRAHVTGWEPVRNAAGVIRETRALWVSPTDLESREATDDLIERAQRARLNVLVPDIFVRNRFMANNSLDLPATTHEDRGDPLAYFVEKAHAVGMEVHPWFCTTYRDPNFRAWFEQKYGVNVDVIDEDGEVVPLPADLHRPEYRDFMVELMVGVARDYDVDGLHHDYIRVMKDCYCDDCQAEFEAGSGKPLAEATEEEWIACHRQAVGDIVQRVAEGAREIKPEITLSAAVFSNMDSGARQGQDSPGWAREGWVDLVIPMDYAMQTLLVRTNERRFLEALDDDDQLVSGLSLYQKSGGEASPRPAAIVREQVELVRSMGIRGYCLFVGKYLDEEIIKTLRTNVNTERAVPYFR